MHLTEKLYRRAGPGQKHFVMLVAKVYIVKMQSPSFVGHLGSEIHTIKDGIGPTSACTTFHLILSL